MLLSGVGPCIGKDHGRDARATVFGHCRDGITSALCGIRGALIMRFARVFFGCL